MPSRVITDHDRLVPAQLLRRVRRPRRRAQRVPTPRRSGLLSELDLPAGWASDGLIAQRAEDRSAMTRPSPSSPLPLELTVSEPRPDIAVLTLRGELDLRTARTADILATATSSWTSARSRSWPPQASRSCSRPATPSVTATRTAAVQRCTCSEWPTTARVHRVLAVLDVEALFSTFRDLQECLCQL
jgi:hypothetical protein